MDRESKQTESSTRRRSMLPQRNISTRISTYHNVPVESEMTELDSKPEPQPTLRSSMIGPFNGADAKSMPPPPSVMRSRPVRLSTSSSSSASRQAELSRRTSSIGRAPTKDHLQAPTCTTSIARTPVHARSMSQSSGQQDQNAPAFTKAMHTRQASLSTLRPAFSAMQQHYTPKQTTKSQEPKSVLPFAKPNLIPASECSHLQRDLAQLHLLHRSAHAVQTQWEQSAKDYYVERFHGLCERHSELKEIAQQQQILINQVALVKWAQGKTGSQIADKVQQLSRNISELCNLLSADGKFTRILEIFEEWFTQALTIREQRDGRSRKQAGNMTIVEGIGDGWKAEAMVLERELTYCLRDMGAFGAIQSVSGLGRLLALYSKLIANLLEELDVVQWIEDEIVSRERHWVENAITNLATNIYNRQQ